MTPRERVPLPSASGEPHPLGECAHTTCAKFHLDATHVCSLCKKEIGYGVSFVRTPYGVPQHWVCTIEAQRQANTLHPPGCQCEKHTEKRNIRAQARVLNGLATARQTPAQAHAMGLQADVAELGEALYLLEDAAATPEQREAARLARAVHSRIAQKIKVGP